MFTDMEVKRFNHVIERDCYFVNSLISISWGSKIFFCWKIREIGLYRSIWS